MDANSFGAILRLMSQDLDAIAAGSKGKAREDDVSDAGIARCLFREEVTQSLVSLADHAMAKSIAQAVECDSVVIAEVKAIERQSADDRAQACQLADVDGNISAPPAPSISHEPPGLSDELFRLLVAFNAVGTSPLRNDIDEDCPENSSTLAQVSCGFAARQKRCEACQDDHHPDEMLKAPCEHLYCQTCSHELFTASMTDESLFPPRCCRQPIPCEDFEHILVTNLMNQFQLRKEETESCDRTYCAQPDCNKFIPKSCIVADIARCDRCETKTCTHCKDMEHHGECPQDESYQLLVEIAKEQGWQQCSSCKRFIELDTGCNHMT